MSGTLGQIIRLGLKSLLLQKMRSSLAALGIFIGTTTVIWLVAMGEGVSYQAQQQILELGATNIIVRSVEPNASGGDKNRVKSYGLLRADFRRILSNVPTITRAVPIRELRRECRVDSRTTNINLVGCTERLPRAMVCVKCLTASEDFINRGAIAPIAVNPATTKNTMPNRFMN